MASTATKEPSQCTPRYAVATLVTGPASAEENAMMIEITADGRPFRATLAEIPASRDLHAQLPQGAAAARVAGLVGRGTVTGGAG